MKAPLEPLRFERHFVPTVWGGRSLERRPGIVLPDDGDFGETWEVVDRPTENSVVATGTFQGVTLGELMRMRGAELLGKTPPTKDGRFPLLVKYIDAADNLSVQVHPDEDSARRVGGEPKTEAWYVLDVAPGGCLYCGVKPTLGAEDFAPIADGPDVLGAILRWDVQPGDCLLVPGGTVHAIGKGVTILEVQQNSDTTYRLWDWGRVGRETHVEKALPCIRFGDPERAPTRPAYQVLSPGIERAELARSSFFSMDSWHLSEAREQDTDGRAQVIAVIEGSGALTLPGQRSYDLCAGDVWLLPASVGAHRLEPDDRGLSLVQMRGA